MSRSCTTASVDDVINCFRHLLRNVMAALGGESGMADDHAPYPRPCVWVPLRLVPLCVPLVGIRPNVQILTGTLQTPRS
jgi:hypothetical protein